jgi:hypothetical protein
VAAARCSRRDQLLEQIHFGSPVHARPLIHLGDRS